MVWVSKTQWMVFGKAGRDFAAPGCSWEFAQAKKKVTQDHSITELFKLKKTSSIIKSDH